VTNELGQTAIRQPQAKSMVEALRSALPRRIAADYEQAVMDDKF
jgi:hypothetical protein